MELFNEGKLGELLVRAFGGGRSRLYPIQDSEFLILFESDEETPDIETIAKTVKEHYWNLGYDIENQRINGDRFEAIISYDRRKMNGCCVGLVITTHYPFDIGANRTSLRATCTFLARPS